MYKLKRKKERLRTKGARHVHLNGFAHDTKSRSSLTVYCGWLFVLLVLLSVEVLVVIVASNGDGLTLTAAPLLVHSKLRNQIMRRFYTDPQLNMIQRCIVPTLKEDDNFMKKLVQFFVLPECSRKNWLYVQNGTVRFSKVALRGNRSFTCDYYPISRVDESNFRFGEPIRNISDGFAMVSDFFKGVCQERGRVVDEGLYMGVHHNNERALRSEDVAAPTSGLGGMSIAVLGFDSMSRMSWLRRLPRTRKYFHDTLGAVELQAHNIVGEGTTAAMFPMLTGKSEAELPNIRREHPKAIYLDTLPFVWHKMKDAGYLTSWCNARPSTAPFNWRYLGFEQQPTDFYTRTFFSALNEDNWLEKSDAFCIRGRPQSQVWLDYFRDIFLMYREQRKFLFHFYTDLSHDDNNPITMMDAGIRDLVKFLHESGHLNNTLLILMGDHGSRFGPLASSWEGMMEERLPYFGLLFPKWFQREYPHAMANLRRNSMRLTTPFDVHETFLDVLDFGGTGEGKLSHRGISLFKEIPFNRTCQHAGISAHWCTCLHWKSVPVWTPAAQEAAKAAIDTINSWTEDYREDCTLLKLDSISSVGELTSAQDVPYWDQDKALRGTFASIFTLYQLTFSASPGGAVFVTTVTYYKAFNRFDLDESEISRVNMYGNASSCIWEKNRHLSPFCYCTRNTA